MTKATPRERRHRRTRQAILDTALGLIVEKGPDQLSLREIARRMDYSPAGLYEYFGSKDAIIEAVCGEADERLRVYLRAVPLGLGPAEYLIELGLAYVRFARQNPEHFMFLFHNQESPLDTDSPPPDPPPDPTPQEELEWDESFLILMTGIRRAMDTGIIVERREYEPHDIAYSLWAMVHGMALLQAKYAAHMPFNFETADRQALAAFIRGLG